MSEQMTAPYGSWKSPITSELIVSQTIGLGAIAVDGDDIYWIEARPMEAGRNVIVRRRPDGAIEDVTPAPFNARTRVHEYGGAAYAVADGTVYFSNFSDQRLYRQRAGAAPEVITPEAPLRYADAVVDGARNRLICVREDHSGAGQAVNTIVALDAGGDADGGTVLISGSDFYSTPRLSPDGRRLSWLTWNHPNMPWDGTELWVADVLPDGTLANAARVAGGQEESIFQPAWSPDGTLTFASDRTGWWNLYQARDGQLVPLHPMDAEFGRPQWAFGAATYTFLSAHEIISAYTQNGLWHLARINTATGDFADLNTPHTAIGESIQAQGASVIYLGGSSTQPTEIARLDVNSSALETLRASANLSLDARYLSPAEPLDYPTEGGETAHGLFYAPHNQDYVAPAGDRPPLLVRCHGGPTSAASSALNLSIQYWTSRGIAVLDVNYGGSTGYGRPYRDRLKDHWGIVDVQDCVAGARALASRGLVDGNRLMITGGSAGGYTTLAVLTFTDVFHAGGSHFGVSDLEGLATETHKFESRYLDSLIGPYPERVDLYHERSPLYHTDQLSRPIIFFQGLEDKVVPPNQAERMVQALRERSIPVAYLAFEGEGHGFRRAENIRRSLDGELYFYSRIFGFPLGEQVEPVEIENMG